VARHLIPTAAARVRSPVRSCKICGGKSFTEAGYTREHQFPLPILIALTAPYSSIIQVSYKRPTSDWWLNGLSQRNRRIKKSNKGQYGVSEKIVHAASRLRFEPNSWDWRRGIHYKILIEKVPNTIEIWCRLLSILYCVKTAFKYVKALIPLHHTWLISPADAVTCLYVFPNIISLHIT
jgi:hypothetical protein